MRAISFARTARMAPLRTATGCSPVSRDSVLTGEICGTRYPLSNGAPGSVLGRCNNFVEQREHRSMASYIVDFDECGGAVQWTHSLDGKVVSRTVVPGNLVRRR